MDQIRFLKLMAAKARLLAVDAVHEAKAGHPGGSLSCMDALTALGYSAVEAREALQKVRDQSDRSEELIRLALRAMAGA